MITLRRGALGLLALPVACAACSGTEPAGPGRHVAIQIAPMTSPGIGVACFDLQVETDAGVLWTRGNPNLTRLGANQTSTAHGALRPMFDLFDGSLDTGALCSDSWGNAGVGIAYNAPCDASPDADTNPEVDGVQNIVELWVDGLYDAGLTQDLGDWQDPCAGGCSQEITCTADSDVRVSFDLLVLRDGGKGFFDIAVSFDQIFCSAKLDCVSNFYDHMGADGRPDGASRRTVMVGFACTTGPGQDTYLYWEHAAITCDQGSLTLDPAEGEGNLGPLTFPGQATPGIFQHGIYRHSEEVTVDGQPIDKCFWNMAFGLEPAGLGTNCYFDATATAAPRALDPMATPTNVAYPLVHWHVPLNGESPEAIFCGPNPLNGDESGVVTTYAPTSGLPLAVGAACDGAPQRSSFACTGTNGGSVPDGSFAPGPNGQVTFTVHGASVTSSLPSGLHLASECCVEPCCEAAP